ncbi:hypothetical protein [Streptomyces sp. TRM70350]|uniref:hypothetical protein n=1 Tax=Streptomyces sp. TRM70350 TaxID=2856165 RepID=UPI001C450697|nr:hypothetical protein [Streptomyces sp. TRM70350]MBV7698130.1 hypothetical protein [Streptomyces sp. TRM70350]
MSDGSPVRATLGHAHDCRAPLAADSFRATPDGLGSTGDWNMHVGRATLRSPAPQL